MNQTRERGQGLILLAVALTALLGFAAISVDVGRWVVARQRMSNVCDMAALGGAAELTTDAQSAGRAQRAVLDVIDANSASGTPVTVSHVVGPNNPDVIISYYNDTVATNTALTSDVVWADSRGNPVPRPAPNRGMIVRGRQTVPATFGTVIGMAAARDIPGRATVVLGQASTIIGGILPFGVSKDSIANLESYPSLTVEHELTYRTWQEAWGTAPGAFGTLAPDTSPGETSASALEFNICWSYPGAFSVGQVVATTNGNTTGAIRSGLVDRLARSQFGTVQAWIDAFYSSDAAVRATAMSDSRLVMFPIIDPAAVVVSGSGTAQSVQIYGFATYVISDWQQGTQKVYGYFVKSNYEGSVSPSGVNFGSLAYHLI